MRKFGALSPKAKSKSKSVAKSVTQNVNKIYPSVQMRAITSASQLYGEARALLDTCRQDEGVMATQATKLQVAKDKIEVRVADDKQVVLLFARNMVSAPDGTSEEDLHDRGSDIHQKLLKAAVDLVQTLSKTY